MGHRPRRPGALSNGKGDGDIATQFYKLVINDRPDDPFGMIAIERTPTTEHPLHLNRRTKVWEEDGTILDYFIGESAGQRALPLSKSDAALLAAKFGAALP